MRLIGLWIVYQYYKFQHASAIGTWPVWSHVQLRLWPLVIWVICNWNCLCLCLYIYGAAATFGNLIMGNMWVSMRQTHLYLPVEMECQLFWLGAGFGLVGRVHLQVTLVHWVRDGEQMLLWEQMVRSLCQCGSGMTWQKDGVLAGGLDLGHWKSSGLRRLTKGLDKSRMLAQVMNWAGLGHQLGLNSTQCP